MRNHQEAVLGRVGRRHVARKPVLGGRNLCLRHLVVVVGVKVEIGDVLSFVDSALSPVANGGGDGVGKGVGSHT